MPWGRNTELLTKLKEPAIQIATRLKERQGQAVACVVAIPQQMAQGFDIDFDIQRSLMSQVQGLEPLHGLLGEADAH